MAETELTETSPTRLKRITELKKELKRLVNEIVDQNDFRAATFDETQRVLSELKELNIKESHETFTDHFRCHISKEIMTDPVILASGQTYDRKSIQSQLDEGNLTCPKTKQALPDAKLIPNYLLRDVILHWCKHQGIKPPPNPVKDLKKKPLLSDNSNDTNEELISKGEEEAQLESLLQKLESQSISEQKAAAKELRRLTKTVLSSRVYFGKSPQIVSQLLSPLKLDRLDLHPDLQEDLITTVLNISINKDNKSIVIKSPRVIDFLVGSLKTGNVNTRSNAAAALFTLSGPDDNKIIIGKSGAIKSLIHLIKEGDSLSLKDAAQALFKLCIPENKKRAVLDGAVPVLLNKIMENTLVTDFLSILAWLSTDVEAANLLSMLPTVPCMLRIIKETTCELSKENCISILYNACISNPHTWLELRTEENANGTISNLAENGTDKSKRKANALRERIFRSKMVEHHTA